MLRWLRVFRSAVPPTWAIPPEARCISPHEKRTWPAESHLEELGFSSTVYKTYTTGAPFLPNSLWLQPQCLQHQQIPSVWLRKSCALNLLLLLSSCLYHPLISFFFHKSIIFPSALQMLCVQMCSDNTIHYFPLLWNLKMEFDSLQHKNRKVTFSIKMFL